MTKIENEELEIITRILKEIIAMYSGDGEIDG